jgi:membrane-bound metal-dependent hydrolase YbcI (DUF457 family)
MKIPEHVTFSFLLAQFGVQQQYGPWGTALMIGAGMLPDLDGLTVLAGWRVYRKYHRIIGHGLPVSIGGPLVLTALASFVFQLGPFWPLWFWIQLAVLAHLLIDVWFYTWPVQLLWPLSRRGWGVGLLDWNDLVPTLTLYAASAAVLIWPRFAALMALAGLGGVLAYVAWRARHPQPSTRLAGWLAGGWTQRAPQFWRWLTGDFVS